MLMFISYTKQIIIKKYPILEISLKCLIKIYVRIYSYIKIMLTKTPNQTNKIRVENSFVFFLLCMKHAVFRTNYEYKTNRFMHNKNTKVTL